MSLFTAGEASSCSSSSDVPIARFSNLTAGEASSSSSSSNVPTAVSTSLAASEAEAAFASPSSSSPAERLIYDVFLSFRGSDTRHGFISHLYNALKQKGISTFKDDQKLERGKFISPEILRVIRQSRFSIVVFSRDYASSPWCLEELQTIITGMEEEETKAVLPIFYGVDPSDVSEVKNSYAESFARHEKDFAEDSEMIRSWRDALNKAAELSGWDSRNRDEPGLIDEIVADVLNKLGRESSNKHLERLFGMETRMKEVELLLSTGLVDVRMVGIRGMPGIGKTTTAEAVYHHISRKFDACCFVKSIREVMEKHGLDYLRNKLLSALIVEDGLTILDEQLDVLMKGRLRSKCVLVVLDDVSHVDQLTSLAGDREWFGPGSRIIITTKDKHLLEQHEVDSIYEAKPLSNAESLELFRQHAFRKVGSPIQEFMLLSERVVNYAQGLPLALKVLGSSLFNMDTGAWESKLNELEVVPPQDVVKILRLSFDALDRHEKSIFLDVACFFKGQDEDYVVSILEGCGFSAHYGLRVLIRRSLVSIQDNKVLMHDLLQQMGWEVVRQESTNGAGMYSRLWNHQDVCNAFSHKMGTSNVEGIALDISRVNDLCLEVENFHEMSRLRLLKICHLHQSGIIEYLVRKESCFDTNYKGNDASTLGKLKTLAHELGSRQWLGHAFNWLKRTDTTAEGSKLCFSGKLKSLSNELRCLHWHGYPFESLPLKFYPQNLVEFNLSCSLLRNFWQGSKAFSKLKFMKLSDSLELIHTPDFSLIQNLEILILEGCIKLIKVHPSVGSLQKLSYLNLKGCKSLRSLPPSIGMRSLEIITLSGCSKLKKFPEVEGNMERLSELILDGTDVAEIPVSIQKLTGLLVLSVTGCKRLEFIPEVVGFCRALKILRLSGCPNLHQVQFELKLLENLEVFDAEGTALKLRSLFAGSQLKKLKVLTIRGSNSKPSFTQRYLTDAVGWDHLTKHYHFAFPEYFSLTTLDLSHCNLYDPLCDFRCLVHLLKLDLSGNHFSLLYNGQLPENLEVLILANCRKLGGLPRMPPTLYCLEAPNCTSLSYISLSPGNESGRMQGINLLNCLKVDGIFMDVQSSPSRECIGKVVVGFPLKKKVAVELLENHLKKVSADIFLSLFLVPSNTSTQFFHLGSTLIFSLHPYALQAPSPSHLVSDLSVIAPYDSIIPEWLPYQRMGSTMAAVMLPPDWYNNTLKGLALWATFHLHGTSVASVDLSLEFCLRSNGQNVISETGFVLSCGTKVESEHMWLRFVPAFMFKTVRRRESWSPVEAVVVTGSPELVVKSCGLVPVCCDQDGQLVDINA